MRLCSIASGSSGNCIYVGSDTTHILVDVGISGKRITEGLSKLGVKPDLLDGIFITHEHTDHVQGLGVMARKYGIPIFATRGTIDSIKGCASLGKIEQSLLNEVVADEKIKIKDLTMNPMRISHDAAEPVAYRVIRGKQKIGIVTDLGCYNDYTVECLKGMNALLLEANHDVNMLQVGPYPYMLKKRILGERGHLSNEMSGQLLSKIMNKNLRTVILGHLSKDNNLPELAYEAVRVELLMAMGVREQEPCDLQIKVANRSEISEIYQI